jgi:phenylalanyl-tRNA synthetase alpha chain
LQARLEEIEASARREIARAEGVEALAQLRVRYLGRKSELSELLSKVKELPAEDRPKLGQLGNRIKQAITAAIEAREAALKQAQETAELRAAKLDVTLPGFRIPLGHQHPLTRTLEDIVEIFEGMGFWVEEGPDAESDYYNFEALNIPKDHPARDMQATFFLGPEVVLRTHTSPVQIRAMRKYPPPVRIICPGRVYRCDADLSHSPMFHQVEGFMVDERITLGDLKGVLMAFCRQMFGEQVKIRFRPSYFPFTEPSAEVDISCVICGGSGCGVCKQTGWIEVLGSGLVHPQVLKNVGYDPEKVSGFAFGLGVERITMLRYRVDNIRSFFENDLRFLRQF